jgi:hypothetical protein
LEVLLAFWREEVKPVVRVLECRDLLIRDVKLLQDFVLGKCWLNDLGVLFDFLG